MTTPLRFVYDDGGRAAAGFKGDAGDCVVRAIAIATMTDYREVYDDLFAITRSRGYKPRVTKYGTKYSRSPRDGVTRNVYEGYLRDRGWFWVPTMKIGQGTTVHLAEGELPPGRLIVRVSKHMCAVTYGVVHDTYDPTREGTRCVYGYFTQERPLWDEFANIKEDSHGA